MPQDVLALDCESGNLGLRPFSDIDGAPNCSRTVLVVSSGRSIADIEHLGTLPLTVASPFALDIRPNRRNRVDGVDNVQGEACGGPGARKLRCGFPVHPPARIQARLQVLGARSAVTALGIGGMGTRMRGL